MRRAVPIIAVIACLVGAACDANLPDRYWRSDDVRYFSRPDDDAICPAILDELEQHGQTIADVLMIQRTPVSYYKFRDDADYKANSECPANAAACSVNATVRSPVDFDRHELIHAYLAPYGRPPRLLAEGAAVALSCQHYPRPTGSWRDVYALEHVDQSVYAAGGWLVGYLLKMFPARLLPRLYNRLAINATADQFAQAFEDVYFAGNDCHIPNACITLDQVWAAAIGGDDQPMRCPWECGRPALATDGHATPLAPVCSGGTLQLSVDAPAAGLSRWFIDGAGTFKLQSCEGHASPNVNVAGTTGTGELIAPLAPGSYFIDAAVDAGGTPSLSATIDTGAGLSWSNCGSAPALPDGLTTLSMLTLFYPSQTTPQFTRFAAVMRSGLLVLTSDDPTASATLCEGCATQSCQTTDQSSQALPTYEMPDPVLTVPAGAAVAASFYY
jgi:hypothetical protein